ncbi:MAG: 3-methyl-2-oxobutanoate hydroxymethyltransferase [bacterium]
MSKWTVTKIKAMKGTQKISCLTAYDYTMARLVDQAGIQLVLVGDSLAMTMLGYSTTLPVTMEEMLHHTRAVARGVKEALVVADMPFMSYHVTPSQAVKNAGVFIKAAGADAVKVEGGRFRVPAVRALVANGIPVLGHIGLTPQSIRAMGGYKVQGKKPDEAQGLIDDAIALEKAGVFAIVLECVPKTLGREITRAVGVPTIGIGAGPHCDGQILVIHDMLGFVCDDAPKLTFVKRYAGLGAAASRAIRKYRLDIENGRFPNRAQSF